MKKKIFIILCAICLIIPTSFIFTGCFNKDPEKKQTGISVVFNDEMVDIEHNTFRLSYDMADSWQEKLVVKVNYDDATQETINKIGENAQGYVLTHNLPQHITEEEIGEIYSVSVSYSDFTTLFSIIISKKVDEITVDIADKVYDGETININVTKQTSEDAVIKWFTANGETLVSAPRNAGDYYVEVSTQESSTYEATFVRKDFSISKATPNEPNTSVIENYTYSPSLQLAGISLPENFIWEDETITPTCDVLEYFAIYNPDKTNYHDLKVSIAIHLMKATPAYDIPTLEEIYYSSDISNIKSIQLPESYSWKSNQSLQLGTNSYVFIFTPQDVVNYKIIEAEVEFTYKKTIYSPTISSIYSYTGYEQTCTLSDFSGQVEIDGSLCDYTQTEAGEYDISVKIKEPDKYCWYVDKSTANISLKWTIHQYTPGLKFVFNATTNAYEIEYFRGDAKTVVIPATYKSSTDDQAYPVNVIQEDAFIYGNNANKVYFLAPVTAKDSAFGSKITSVVIPNIDIWYQMKFYSREANPLHAGASLYVGDSLVTTVTPNAELHDYAFYGCGSIKKVDFSELTDFYAQYAFADCLNLEEIVIKDNMFDVLMFDNNTKLKTITQKSGSNGNYKVEKNCIIDTATQTIIFAAQSEDFDIDGATKLDLDALTAIITKSPVVNISSNITEIDGSNSYVWQNMTKINYNNIKQCFSIIRMMHYSNNVELFVNNNKVTHIIVPQDVTMLPDDIFGPYKDIESITLHKDIEEIGLWSAARSTNLYIEDLDAWLNVNLKDAVLTATNVYFNGQRLTKLEIPTGVTEIKDYTFAGLKQITELIIPSGLVKIGVSSFAGCEGLKDVKIPTIEDWLKIEFVDQDLFNGHYGSNPLYYAENLYANGILVTKLDTRTISGITAINNSAFIGYKKLTEVIISANITRIGSHAFYGCSNIAGITFIDKTDWGYYGDANGYQYFSFDYPLSVVASENVKYFVENYTFINGAEWRQRKNYVCDNCKAINEDETAEKCPKCGTNF